MLPNDDGPSEAENAVEGTSMLPLSTIETSDDMNFEVAVDLVFLLHFNHCRGGRPGAKVTRNKPCSWIARIFQHEAMFATRINHFITCRGQQNDCTYPYCRQSHALYNHWITCNKEVDCFICSPAVQIFMKQFCSYLRQTNSPCIREIPWIQRSNLKALRGFLGHPEDDREDP